MDQEKDFLTVLQENNFSWGSFDTGVFKKTIIDEFQNFKIYDWFYKVKKMIL